MGLEKYIIKLTIFILFLFLYLRSAITASSHFSLENFQITDTGVQENAPLIDNNIVVFRRHESSVNIYGYDLKKKKEFPLVTKPHDQLPTGFHGTYLIYEDQTGDPTDLADLRLLNTRTRRDVLVAGGSGSQTSGVTDGKYVVYIDGGACGTLHAYDIRRGTTKKISDTACDPLSIWDGIVVWGYAAPGGTDIFGYDLGRNRTFTVTNEDYYQESPFIYRNTVVWYHYEQGTYGTYQAIKMKNIDNGKETLVYETNTDSLNHPVLSNKYVVWSQSPSLHIGSVMGKNIKTGEIFEIQEPGDHQNSHTGPDIWEDIAVWQAWRTGNGDIFAAMLGR